MKLATAAATVVLVALATVHADRRPQATLTVRLYDTAGIPANRLLAAQGSAAAVLEDTFGARCASCHPADLTGHDDAPALARPRFQALWKKRSTKELLDYMSGAMPPGGSTLKADDYAAIVAYILERNGAAAGNEKLTASTAISIESVVR